MSHVPLFSDGESVEAMWTDGHWYDAVVEYETDQGNFYITYTEYKTTAELSADKIRKIKGKNSNPIPHGNMKNSSNNSSTLSPPSSLHKRVPSKEKRGMKQIASASVVAIPVKPFHSALSSTSSSSSSSLSIPVRSIRKVSNPDQLALSLGPISVLPSSTSAPPLPLSLPSGVKLPIANLPPSSPVSLNKVVSSPLKSERDKENQTNKERETQKKYVSVPFSPPKSSFSPFPSPSPAAFVPSAASSVSSLPPRLPSSPPITSPSSLKKTQSEEEKETVKRPFGMGRANFSPPNSSNNHENNIPSSTSFNSPSASPPPPIPSQPPVISSPVASFKPAPSMNNPLSVSSSRPPPVGPSFNSPPKAVPSFPSSPTLPPTIPPSFPPSFKPQTSSPPSTSNNSNVSTRPLPPSLPSRGPLSAPSSTSSILSPNGSSSSSSSSTSTSTFSSRPQHVQHGSMPYIPNPNATPSSPTIGPKGPPPRVASSMVSSFAPSSSSPPSSNNGSISIPPPPTPPRRDCFPLDIPRGSTNNTSSNVPYSSSSSLPPPLDLRHEDSSNGNVSNPKSKSLQVEINGEVEDLDENFDPPVPSALPPAPPSRGSPNPSPPHSPSNGINNSISSMSSGSVRPVNKTKIKMPHFPAPPLSPVQARNALSPPGSAKGGFKWS